MFRVSHTLFTLLLASALAACVPIIDKRGVALHPDDIAKLQNKTTTQADVLELLGRPSLTSVSEKEQRWLYVSSTFVSRPLLAPREVERTVLALEFDERNVLQTHRFYDKDDGNILAFVNDKTPTRGKEVSALRQIFSNLGRFNSGGPTVPTR